MSDAAIAVCATCGIPVRVIFENGEVTQVFAVCRHIEWEGDDR